jgi:hypothetical protein
MTSNKKVAANRKNGQKSHGPTNTTSTRFNATKHGLLAVGITELDDAEGYRTILSNLREEKIPVGMVETLLVEAIALDLVRLRRARRLEAEYITSELNPPIHGTDPFGNDMNLFQGVLLDPGLPALMSSESAQRLVNVFQRYESIFLSRILRLFHELERLQRMRSGEKLPAPTAVDVSVHASVSPFPEVSAESRIAEEVPVASEQSKSLSSGGDLGVHGDAGVNSGPEASEQRKNPPVEENSGPIAKRTQ